MRQPLQSQMGGKKIRISAGTPVETMRQSLRSPVGREKNPDLCRDPLLRQRDNETIGCLIVSLSQQGPPSLPPACFCLSPRIGCLIVSAGGGPSLALVALCLNPRIGCLIVSLSQQGVPSLALVALCLNPRIGCLSGFSVWGHRKVTAGQRARD